ncbi:MAG: hypothetical protein QXE04_00255, partial [Thermoplasmatales archaeon]
MLNALTKQVVADLKEHFGVDEVYVMTSDVVGEFMNIALRKLKDVDISDERKVFEVMNTPVVFVRLMDVRYDEGRSGFRKMFTGWGWFNSYDRYFGLKLFTLVVGYEVRVYSLFFAQCLDLVSWFLFLILLVVLLLLRLLFWSFFLRGFVLLLLLLLSLLSLLLFFFVLLLL